MKAIAFMLPIFYATSLAAQQTPYYRHAAQGAGGNYIFVDPVNDVVVVLRWTRDFNGVIDRIINSLEKD